jgi:hypothetical protein
LPLYSKGKFLIRRVELPLSISTAWPGSACTRGGRGLFRSGALPFLAACSSPRCIQFAHSAAQLQLKEPLLKWRFLNFKASLLTSASVHPVSCIAALMPSADSAQSAGRGSSAPLPRLLAAGFFGSLGIAVKTKPGSTPLPMFSTT